MRGARRLQSHRARARGFTIVELIAVLLLLGILAATATSRMVGGNAYAPALISQQLIALGRLAQQTAMSRQDVSVSLEVDQNAGDWRFRVQVNDGATTLTVREERTEMANTSIVAANGATTLPLGAAAPLRLAFDGLGNLSAASVAATPLVPGLGVGVRTNGDAASSVCIGSAGHAYRGNCS